MKKYDAKNTRDTGGYYEKIAAQYLEAQGYIIVQMNYRCRKGEIDLIAREGRTLVFVEVKYRRSFRQGGAFMAVDHKKQHRVSRVAAHYLLEEQIREDTPCRFDVVGIDGSTISLIRNAFDYC